MCAGPAIRYGGCIRGEGAPITDIHSPDSECSPARGAIVWGRGGYLEVEVSDALVVGVREAGQDLQKHAFDLRFGEGSVLVDVIEQIA